MYKKKLLFLFILLVSYSAVLFPLGKADIISRKSSGAPRSIGVVIISHEDFFINYSAHKIQELAAEKYNTNVFIVETEKSQAEQIQAITNLFNSNAIRSIIIEVVDAKTAEKINDFAIKNRVTVTYINELHELPDKVIPSRKRIIRYSYIREFAPLLLDFAKEKFKSYNYRTGNVIVLSDDKDPIQREQAQILVNTFDNKSDEVFKSFNVSFASPQDFQEGFDLLNNYLKNLDNIRAIFTTSNILAKWSEIAIQSYLSSISTATGVNARRSDRQARVENRKAALNEDEEEQTEKKESILILSANLQSDFFDDVDSKSISMSTYNSVSEYAEEILERTIKLAEGKKVQQIETYHPNLVTHENIFNFAKDLEETKRLEEEFHPISKN